MPKPVKEHLADISMSHKQFSDLLVWLLGHDILLQLHAHLVLLVPESFELEWEPSAQQLGGGGEVRTEGARVELNKFEQAYIDSVMAAGGGTPSDVLFARLCQYGHGGHHLDEIVWRENLTHHSVSEVLNNPKYAALTTILHPIR